MTMHTGLGAVFVSLVVGASGCGACDPASQAEALAGPGAIDCGYATLSEDRAAVLDCAEAAQARGDAFFVGWQTFGRDSEVRYYRTLDADGAAWSLGFDRGVPGGRTRLSGSECTTPFVRMDRGAPFGESFDCLGDEQPTVFCD